MILVLAGTKDGRELAAALTNLGHEVVASVISAYGRILAESGVAAVNDHPMDLPAMRRYLVSENITLVVDATHPYAKKISEVAIDACEAEKVHYIRYERPTVPLPFYDKLYEVEDAVSAARLAGKFGQTVFLTTGSRTLASFIQAPALTGHRIIARVLPEPNVVAECRALGLLPRDIIAMEGPFSHELNVAMFREFSTDVVITKNSGFVGGSDTKISAAMELGLYLIVIARPAVRYPNIVYGLEEALRKIGEVRQ